MLCSAVAQRQLASAAPAPDQPGKQSLAMLWRSMATLVGMLPETIVRIASTSPG